MNLEIRVEEDFGSGKSKIWLREKDRLATIHYEAGELICNERRCGEQWDPSKAKPFLELPAEYVQDILRAFAEYANNSGIETEKKSYTEGELSATKIHLYNVIEINKAIIDVLGKP